MKYDSKLNLIVKSKHGKLLSRSHRTVNDKAKFQCVAEHRPFHATVSNVLGGSWCSKCAVERRSKIERDRTFAAVLKAVRRKNGKCLSKSYSEGKQKLKFKCAVKAHKPWDTLPSVILRGGWCTECGKEKLSKLFRSDLVTLKKTIAKRGGKVLSKEYINGKTKLQFECAEGHRWFAMPNSIKSGCWCNECAKLNRAKTRMNHKPKNFLVNLARKRSGKCLTPEYKGMLQKYQWECRDRHLWWAVANSIARGTWCRECGRKNITGSKPRLKSDEVKRRLKTSGLKWVGGEYKNQTSILKVVCSEGHRREVVAVSLLRGSGCAECAPNRGLTLKDIRLAAKERNGRLLSRTYKNAHQKLKWECQYKHVFYMDYDHVKQGSWCTQCNISRGEEICRSYFEQIFKTKFQRTRPSWLRNVNGNLMEIDGYSEKLGIAFEHHGEYHYNLKGYYSKTAKELSARQKEDRYKVRLCKKNRIKLFVIPEIPKLTPIEKLKSIIKRQARKLHVLLPQDFESLKLKTPVTFGSHTFEKVKEVCRIRKAKLLSASYVSAKTKLDFECKEGHRFSMSSDHVNRGGWCLTCSRVTAAKKRSKTMALNRTA